MDGIGPCVEGDRTEMLDSASDGDVHGLACGGTDRHLTLSPIEAEREVCGERFMASVVTCTRGNEFRNLTLLRRSEFRVQSSEGDTPHPSSGHLLPIRCGEGHRGGEGGLWRRAGDCTPDREGNRGASHKCWPYLALTSLSLPLRGPEREVCGGWCMEELHSPDLLILRMSWVICV
jgi:hypothetical protein